MSGGINLIDTYGELVRESLGRLFGLNDPASLEVVLEHSEWKELRAGEILFHQGEKNTDLYVLLSGRLHALIQKAGGKQEVLGEITRGETVGEMALLTGEPRSASIAAVRDSLLLKISNESFQVLVKKFPDVVFNITRVVIQRLRKVNVHEKVAYKVVNMCLVPGSPGIDMEGFARRFHQSLSQHGNCLLLSSTIVGENLRQKGIAKALASQGSAEQKIAVWLDKMEAVNDFLIYLVDEEKTTWTEKCLRQADEILFVCDSRRGLSHPTAKLLLNEKNGSVAVGKTLVVLHDSAKALPSDTSKLLEGNDFKFHHHIRSENQEDLDRLARFLSGNPLGLVLSGGGAKGLAHIGVYQALAEAGIAPDLVGGTSIGSVIAGLIAIGTNPEDLKSMARDYFLNNPTPVTDLNMLPFIALMKGRKMDKLLQQVFGTTGIEDCWLNFYCVSTNLTHSVPVIHRSGSLARAVRCSISLPGIFPPVLERGCVHVDGGIFNNLPIDVMYSLGVKKIAAVDLEVQSEELLAIEKLPNIWEVLINRLGSSKSRIKIPSLMSTIMQSCTVASDVQARRFRPVVGLYFNPDVSQIGLMEWKRFDEIVEIGYRHALEVLDKWEGF